MTSRLSFLSDSFVMTTLLLLSSLLSWSALAQAQVPQVQVPPAIAQEVFAVERTFEAALAADCAPERCFSKGCFYGRHTTIDQPRSTSLPGLPVEEGIGSTPAQEYLTEARCEFTHERTVPAKDVAALVRRLEQRLSRGWRKVSVVPQLLEPIDARFAEPTQPQEPEEKKDAPEEAPTPPPPPAPSPEPVEPPTWSQQLWSSLLPHFPWMIAIFLMTVAVTALIWASRRLGSATIEEKMLEAQLAQPEPPPAPEPAMSEQEAKERKVDEETAAEAQERIWLNRLASVEGNESGPVVELVREWLKTGDFPMLARAVFIFGDRLSQAFSSDPDLALKKIDFAEYFRDVDESTLPSKSEFFRRLNQHAMSSLLLSQQDVQLYRSLREDFGSGGVLGLMQALPHRYAALLFALVPRDAQFDVARLMPLPLRFAVAEQLLASTRISKEESAYIFACIGAARDNENLPAPPKGVVTDRGPSVDAAAALSVLLPLLPAEQRPGLFARALQGSASAPAWYDDIFYGEMLLRLEPEQRADLLLDVDVRGLAAWLSLQDQEWQRTLTGVMSSSMQGAVRANGSFASRGEQHALARRGQQAIVSALKGQYARGKTSFASLVA